MRKVAELLLVAAVFEICRRMTKHRLNGRIITAPVVSAAISDLLDKWEFILLFLIKHQCHVLVNFFRFSGSFISDFFIQMTISCLL